MTPPLGATSSTGRCHTPVMSERAGSEDVEATYVLGHSDAELRRLAAQALVKDPLTRRFVTAAGVQRGMRVLDVGSGAGDVAMLLATIVGNSGKVVGFDRSAVALEVARGKVAARSWKNVTFVEGTAADLPPGEPFDAVVGRYVLQFQADPSQLLAEVAARARQGAPIVFHELDWSGVSSTPPVPTYDQACSWGLRAVESSGATAHMGARLPATFRSAGLGDPVLRQERLLATGVHIGGLLERFTDLMRTLAPTIVAQRIATAEELDIESLLDRMLAESATVDSTITGHTEVGAWAYV